MIYRIRTYDITASVGGAVAQDFAEWMTKATKYVNEKWPEVQAMHLTRMFQSGEHSFVTRHESVAASIEWYATLMANDGSKALMDELREKSESNGVPSIQSFTDTFQMVNE
jgi:hypothetical protein